MQLRTPGRSERHFKEVINEETHLDDDMTFMHTEPDDTNQL